MSVFFTSDYHFGHKRILEMDNRPFSDIENMADVIIKNHNQLVKPTDTIYILGDFSLCNATRTRAYLERMNGNKHLIKGNHESSVMGNAKTRALFTGIYDKLEIKLHNKYINMDHYSYHQWNMSHHGAWMLHGHSHGGDDYNKNYKILNVGINLHDYKPLSFEQVSEYMSGKQDRKHH